MERAIKTVTHRSSSTWLTVIPLQKDYFDSNEFRDALAIRYNRKPTDLPLNCDGCGAGDFSLSHALCCKTGGLVTRCHNKVRDFIGELCSKSWGQVVKEPIIKETAPCLRGDLAVRGVWEAQREALVDIRVVDTDAPSYASRTVNAVLGNAEEEKKKKYLTACEESHATFAPLVVSVDGVLAPQMNAFMNVLTERLAYKALFGHTKLKALVRNKSAFSIIRADTMCKRGTRRKFYSGETLLGLY